MLDIPSHSSKMVDELVFENAYEPGSHRRARLEGRTLLDRGQQCFLNQILCAFNLTDVPDGVRKKIISMLVQPNRGVSGFLLGCGLPMRHSLNRRLRSRGS